MSAKFSKMSRSVFRFHKFVQKKFKQEVDQARQYAVAASSNLGIGSNAGSNNFELKSSGNGTHLEIQSPAWTKPLSLHSTWLRDHCRCPECYNELTGHKLVNISEIGLSVKPKHTEIGAENLHITWSDGHKTVFNVDWLSKNVYSGYKDSCRPKRKVWGQCMDSISMNNGIVKYNDYMNSDEALKTAMTSIVKYGYAVVQDVPQNLECTQLATERIAPLRLGFFGKLLEHSGDTLHRKFQTSPNTKISPHTDQSYLTEPAGLKVVHCLSSRANLLMKIVDGYFVADELKRSNPEAYATLSEIPLLFEYTDDASHHKCYDVILKHDKLTGNLLQIRYNMYYRSSLTTVPFDSLDQFYSALHAFSQLVHEPMNQLKMLPVKGTMILLDNWRIMASPVKNDDEARMASCYVGWTDYMCRARRLEVVP